ncbi:MAG: hypothetical protein PH343_08945 [Nitrospira sp.]|nr:hypothetical protein [Nitrospira sp.]
MKLTYILIVFVVAALALGCIGNKQAEPSTNAPVSPSGTPVSSSATIVPGTEDPFGTDADVAALDSMLADSSMDISLMDSI